jgi:N-acetylglucosaminyl-diphospho-decaprenol L-rhamnosyltransferase
MSDIDVIILDLDGGGMLQRCIDSLAAQSVRPARIIILDNGSSDPVGRRLQRPSGLKTEIVRVEQNLGFAGGMNAAMKHASAPLVALVNNDVTLDHDWIETLVPHFEREADLAALQCVLRRDEVTLDGAGIDISDGTFRQAGAGESIEAEIPDAWGVSATAAIYRRDATGREMFDPRFFAYYEDVDLCARLLEEGWTLRVVPAIKATHAGSQSASKLGARARYLRTRNRYWVARKHRGVGSIGALLFEDLKLLVRGRSSLRGILDGLTTNLG